MPWLGQWTFPIDNYEVAQAATQCSVQRFQGVEDLLFGDHPSPCKSRDGVRLTVGQPCLEAESELQNLPRQLLGIQLFLGNGERSRLAVLEQFFQEADFPARVLSTIIRQHRPLRDDKFGFVVCCGCQACGRAKLGLPLFRSALHAFLQDHAFLFVLFNEFHHEHLRLDLAIACIVDDFHVLLIDLEEGSIPRHGRCAGAGVGNG